MPLFGLPLFQNDMFQISYGDTVSDGVPGPGAGNIENAGDQDTYEFEGTTGDDVILDSLVGSSGQYSWRLEAPNGTEIFDSFKLDRRLTLPQTGTYSLVVRGSRADTTGLYSFSLLLVPPAQEFAISIGDTVSDGLPAAGAGNLEDPGAADIYSFDAQADDEVIFDWLAGANGMIGWQLEAPDTTILFDTFLLDRQEVLPQTGTYRLTLRGNSVDDTGQYSFRLLLTPAAQEFEIAIGDIVDDGLPGPGAGNIELPGSQDIYTFDGNAGQGVIFDWLSGSNVLTRWQLQAPDNTVLFDGPLSDRQDVLPQDGTYTLTVRGSGPDITGQYSFQLLAAPSSADLFNINIGDTISDGVPGPGAGNLEAPGAADIYSFDATAGDRVVFDWLSGVNGMIGWRLQAPDGAILFDTFLLDRQEVLPQTGTYMLTVRGNSPDDFGLYSFTTRIGEPVVFLPVVAAVD